MSTAFNPSSGPILVKAELVGSLRKFEIELILDIGTTDTVISEDALLVAGYDPGQSTQQAYVRTAGGVVIAPLVEVHRFSSLGQTKIDFPVVCHNFPTLAGVDGLLGLDFFRGSVLTLDFRQGQVDLS